MKMETSARLIILAGIVLIIIGAIVYALAKLNLPLGQLPGDIRIEGRGGSFYLPLTTSILISIVLSVLVYIIGHFWKK